MAAIFSFDIKRRQGENKELPPLISIISQHPLITLILFDMALHKSGIGNEVRISYEKICSDLNADYEEVVAVIRHLIRHQAIVYRKEVDAGTDDEGNPRYAYEMTGVYVADSGYPYNYFNINDVDEITLRNAEALFSENT